MKYRVIQIKYGEVADNDTNTNLTVAQTGDMDLKQFVLISLKKEVHEQVASDTVNYDELTQIFSTVVQLLLQFLLMYSDEYSLYCCTVMNIVSTVVQ